MSKRLQTNRVCVGKVLVGGGEPIKIQSMTTTKTADIERTVAQITALHEKCKAAGFDIFGCNELLRKYSYSEYEYQKEGLAGRVTLDLSVRFEGIR